MAYNVYDSPNIDTPIAPDTTNSGGFDVQKILANRNFTNLLAGIGAKLDPNGVGGALGGATIAYNAAQASSERADTQEKTKNAQHEKLLQLLETHGGPTPAGTPGLTGFKVGPKGNVIADIDPELQSSGTVPAQNNTTPVASDTTVQNAVPTTPTAPVASTVAPTATSTTIAAPTGAQGINTDIRKVIPFY